ncbi:MAG: hypothetical protein ACRDBO_10565 [Lachnospiraceae bacterium]
MSILEYDEERELKILRREQYEIGKAEGEAKIVAMLRKKMQKQMTVEAIADDLEMEVEAIHQMVRLIEQNPESDDFEIARKFLAI